jgi:hypothetical protein
MIFHAELARVICSGAKRDKQTTFAAFDDRVPPLAAPPIDRAAALAELTRRFFRSRSPARPRDFAWWSGLPLGDVRAGIAANADSLASAPPADAEPIAPPAEAYLLPAYDEYFLGYADRDDVVAPALAARVNAGGGFLRPLIVIDGQIAGVWKRTFARRGAIAVELDPFRALTRRDRGLIDAAAERYATFVGAPLERVG